MTRIAELQKFGQSVWYDNIRRGLIQSGALRKLIEDGVRGVTSNPTIFDKAIGGTAEYDEAIRRLVAEGKDAGQIFNALSVEDIQDTADLLRPIYDQSGGGDGFVSIEVSPLIASDTEATIAEARRLWQEVNRPNLMVKIPATPEGIPAIERSIRDGLNINITLIFALAVYEQVMEAYLRGLEQRVAAGQPVGHISSVASFFVSRVDTLVDKQLDQRIKAATSDQERERLRRLKGKAAVANAKLAYQRFRGVFESERFARLQQRGARLQRPLWASTSTKNPDYPDTMYVDELIGPHTVNTMPDQTIQAFNDHGRLRPNTVEEGLEEARQLMRDLAAAGIDMDAVTSQLIEEGVTAFADSFRQLIATVEGKRALIQSGLPERQHAELGPLEQPIEQALSQAQKDRLVERIWERDPSLWKADEHHAQVIKSRLGWLTVAEAMRAEVPGLHHLADGVRREFKHAVLLGMGGSSLCVEVCRDTFGSRQGFPDVAVLDTTDPATIAACEQAMPPAETLYVVSTKSGGTIETLSLFKYFYERVRAARGDGAGRHFVAITDSGTSLVALAREHGFRSVHLNPSDIGGRYSVLSLFGLLPLAIMGQDLERFLDRAISAQKACGASIPVRDNPGARLGVIMGAAAAAGRDKVTVVCSRGVHSFGTWAEQLLAESTGKQGVGLVPVEGEEVGPPEAYGDDRLFVYLRLPSGSHDGDAALDAKLRALAQAGQPVVTLELGDAYDLAQEFYRWEMATAAAGSLLGIDPFDEPNVQESKDNTSRLIHEFEQRGALPLPQPTWSGDGIDLYAEGLSGGGDLAAWLRPFLAQVRPGDYVALMAYLQRAPATAEALKRSRLALRDRLKVATTLGFGPRFLHSTGQLHKGGPNSGVFLQVTADDAQDLAIPGARYGFSTLKRAQALGDLQSLRSHGRRVIGLHLGRDVQAGLARLAQAIEQALR